MEENKSAVTLESLTNYRRRAERVTRSIQDRAFAIAETVGIPRNLTCLHNASIDDKMTGWCAGSPERLKVAKRAVKMYDGAWAINDLGSRVWRRAYNRTMGTGFAQYEVEQAREINVKLLFGAVQA